MPALHHIDIERYRYHLPGKRIAKYPLPDRDRSRLLCYRRGEITHHIFSDLPQLLPEGSWMVFNDTKVIQARLNFRKSTGALIEIFCLEPVVPADHQQAFLTEGSCRWKCLVGKAKKWKGDPLFLHTTIRGEEVIMKANIIRRYVDTFLVDFSWDRREYTFGEIINAAGRTPIPPYLRREPEEGDRVRYQTIYGMDQGSVAAPTAGLHFSDTLMKKIGESNIKTGRLTLHVGAGTFIPVKEKNARNHRMHSEQVTVSLAFLEQWLLEPGGVIAVGTTTTRSLESIYWLGAMLCEGRELIPGTIHMDQWVYEELVQEITLRESLHALIRFCGDKGIDPFRFTTQLMITPGYSFRTISGLITNYHLPGSTLLLLIAAFIGDDWKKVYAEALERGYRFLSYGDSSILLPGEQFPK